MKKIDSEYIEQMHDKKCNYEKLKKIGLCDKDNNINDNYINMLSTYKLLFDKVLCEMLNLKNYDDILKKSDLNFKNVENDDMDIYQYFSNLDLDYIYIRNNIYLENLNNEEINYLNNKYKSNDFTITKTDKVFIQNTFRKAISLDADSKFNNMLQCYHRIDNPKYFAKDGELVIGVRYNDFYNDGLDDDEWNDKYIEKEKFIAELINTMNNNFSKFGVRVFKYNEYGINKKKINKYK